MVVITAAAGMYLGTRTSISPLLLLHTLFGTGLLSAGTAVLNQFMERDADSRMRRTARRPLPTGKIAPRVALHFGMGLVVAGTLYLAIATNILTAFLGWLTSFIYLVGYTPLKRKTHWCTLIGAVPGAIPPVMGWTAVRGSISLDAAVLFGILFLWQFPHFLAIALLYREDYERGGFIMLPAKDCDGQSTAFRIMWFSVLLVLVSTIPTWTGLVGKWYLLAAVPLGAHFVWTCVKGHMAGGLTSARKVLRASVAYLPFLLLLLAVAKAG